MHRKPLLALLAKYQAQDPVQLETKQKFIDFVNTSPDCFERSNLKAHLTASCLLIDPKLKKLFFVRHKKLGRWLQPGGHADGDNDLLAVSIKEACEESNIFEISALSRDIFDLDIHSIPEHKSVPTHFHFDVRFLLGADSSRPYKASHEAHEVNWFHLNQITNLGLDKSITRLIEKLMLSALLDSYALS